MIIKLISVNLPEAYIKALELLVIEGRFPNRSEGIRVAIRELVKVEFLIEESVKKSLSSRTDETQIESQIQEKLII